MYVDRVWIGVMSMNGRFQIVTDPSADVDGPSTLDIQKDWHGLHYLLARDAWGGEPPLDFIVAGGEEVGDDLGYGPARYFDADDVRNIDVALSRVKDILSTYDGDAMDQLEIYPGGWIEEESSWRESLKDAFDNVRSHFARAASEGKGMLVYLV